MLTQGWTNYNYSRPYDSITIKPEMNLSISGQITSRFFKKRKKTGLWLNLFISGDTQEFDVQNTDSLDRFHFNLKDTYGESIRILIQSGEQSKIKKNFTVFIDREESPKTVIESIPAIDIMDSISITVVKASMERKRID